MWFEISSFSLAMSINKMKNLLVMNAMINTHKNKFLIEALEKFKDFHNPLYKN